ncbi:serine/arginine-rich splicing factor RS41 isoform X1 [Selaginella moellendorffii]|uniref:serine/arginine-rich splicing factor RS41 isoform X3 n=2 Tax=Selaginella moellendorffii TaxID=88036 RepID=UPI000D1C3370|nr:serine/arginine-rich splicing factor RS41 isoform X3 [Selaginella moellendorffii]XP_002986488.2 serine/arginine-rich splicing factor RS41 isoform X1 [Selaginella moellendorffii]|eukprot:XP_002964906.2 serine/arginine-rich splicing factor RS41 isoform X3 [Selaginella moellendorffii]
MSSAMRPVFCGNFEYDARQSEIERMFAKFGKVDRVDMKTGFAFVYMEDERDAEDAIQDLDNVEFGRQRRPLRVEWAKQGDSAIKRREDARRSITKQRPTKTLFVVNFDPINTRTRDLERHFEPYGKLVRVQIRKNFAFVQYESQEEATKALESTHLSKVVDRVISVEYAARENGDPPGRGRRSPSPRHRSRGSPDYGGGRPRSPYSRHRSSRSPVRRYRSRSPDYRPYSGSRH